jgi:hypothetical protein
MDGDSYEGLAYLVILRKSTVADRAAILTASSGNASKSAALLLHWTVVENRCVSKIHRSYVVVGMGQGVR